MFPSTSKVVSVIKTFCVAGKAIEELEELPEEAESPEDPKALPTKVMSSHLQQASFYLHATKKPTWILHVNGKESDGNMIHEVAACKYKEAKHNMITDLKIKQ